MTNLEKFLELSQCEDCDSSEIKDKMIRVMFDTLAELYTHNCWACEENQKLWDSALSRVEELAKDALK